MLATSSGATLATSADEDPMAALRRQLPADSAVPFRPIEEVGRTPAGIVHRWGCTALAVDGRCTIYERRPELCRAFEAGFDPLCGRPTPLRIGYRVLGISSGGGFVYSSQTLDRTAF